MRSLLDRCPQLAFRAMRMCPLNIICIGMGKVLMRQACSSKSAFSTPGTGETHTPHTQYNILNCLRAFTPQCGQVRSCASELRVHIQQWSDVNLNQRCLKINRCVTLNLRSRPSRRGLAPKNHLEVAEPLLHLSSGPHLSTTAWHLKNSRPDEPKLSNSAVFEQGACGQGAPIPVLHSPFQLSCLDIHACSGLAFWLGLTNHHSAHTACVASFQKLPKRDL